MGGPIRALFFGLLCSAWEPMHKTTVLEIPPGELKILNVLAQEMYIFPNFLKLGHV
jgi:hypothetical protein